MRELFYNPSKLTMTVIGALVIVKALYLIFLTNLQDTSQKRAGMFKALRLIIYFIITPALLVVIASCLVNEFIFDKFITLEKNLLEGNYDCFLPPLSYSVSFQAYLPGKKSSAVFSEKRP